MTRMNIDEQVDLLMQGTNYGDDQLAEAMALELKQRLMESQNENRPLRIYCGFDPRTSDLHLGHTIPMRKMRQFQDLGHEVIFVIGRFTSLIGDPSDQDKARTQITQEEAAQNAETYAEQAFKILDPEKTRVEFNDTWLSQLSFIDVIELAKIFTIQQFLTRDNFRDRWDNGEPIFLHETFYALMQGYDALHLKTDVQIGGSDQLFNIITAARKLMELHGEKPNIGIILGILPGTDGVVKMSKSLGNHIPLNTSPEDMYGKVMSIPDSAMGDYFRLVTRWTPKQIESLEKGMASEKQNPRDVKMQLAREIVSIYHGADTVEDAEKAFRKVFQDGGVPEEIPALEVPKRQPLVDLMKESGLARSKSEARRLIQQRGVRLNDKVVEDIHAVITPGGASILQVGKRRFRRLSGELE